MSLLFQNKIRTMNIVIKVFLSCILFLAVCGCEKQDQKPTKVHTPASVDCYQVDPLVKIFQEDENFTDNPLTVEVARGETASFQFVLIPKNMAVYDCDISAGELVYGSSSISPSLEAFEDYIKAGFHDLQNSSVDAMLPPSDMYPDCLKDGIARNIISGYRQPVYITYAIPETAVPGVYTGVVTFSGKANGKDFTIEKEIKAKVYDVTVPEQTFLAVNQHDHKNLSYMSNGERVDLFSTRYWELMKILANSMRDHRLNVYWMTYLPDYIETKLVDGTQADGTYAFDFTNFDKTVEMFIREGGLKRIEGGHLAWRPTGEWLEAFEVGMPNNDGTRPIDSQEARNYLDQFIPALYAHLEEKGWTDIYYQHIADEPVDGVSADSYVKIAKYVKNLVPEMKIMDAVQSSSLGDLVDLWIPELDYFDKDYAFYMLRRNKGDEVWFYTCTNPKGNYANRFLELPLVQMRILHWINFKYNATGYLHWSFNRYWDKAVENIATEGTWPGGDIFIAYPGYEKVYSSMRLEAMRDGIADYELLRLLSEKNPAAAKDIVDSVVMDFDSYNSDISNFRLMRQKLLTELEKY